MIWLFIQLDGYEPTPIILPLPKRSGFGGGRLSPMSGGPHHSAKLQPERKMMGCVVYTPPARRQVNPAGDFPLNPLAVEAVATKKE